MDDDKVGPLRGIYVLLIEDHADTREAIATYLAHQGALVGTTQNGAEALTALGAFRVHVIVSDLAMPGMNGIELMQHIRKLPSEAQRPTPAIAYTASRDLRDAALSAGFQACVLKPVDPARLVEEIVRHASRDVL